MYGATLYAATAMVNTFAVCAINAFSFLHCLPAALLDTVLSFVDPPLV